MKFFDSNIRVGRRLVKDYTPIDTEQELLDLMDQHKIDKALVIHGEQFNIHPEYGNQVLLNWSKSHRIEKVFTILPPSTCEFDYNVISHIKEKNFKAITMFPKQHCFIADRIGLGNFIDEISDLKIPIFLSLLEFSWQEIYNFMRDYPTATVVVTDLQDWSQNRYFYPLLTAFENFYMETNKISLVAGGIEDCVKKFGSERFVFGTAYPRCYISASQMDLMHADISETAKANIAFNNLERILR